MMNIANTASRVFYPKDISALTEAYRSSCDALHAVNDVRMHGSQARYAQETIARLILGYASAGERDPSRLSAATLRQMNAT
jgi:hypothetical protein